MKYGIALPYTTPRVVAKLSQLVEESGWDGVFLGDAVWCEDPMIGLAAAAMVTNKIRGAGAVWMGWQAFPDEVTDVKSRAEMLDETIDILTLLYRREPFDYDGKHYHLKLTSLDVMYYPPKPVQQPRIPLWCVGIWNRDRSMQRALKCDGVIVETRNAANQPVDVTPADVRGIKAFVSANRDPSNPFDIVLNGNVSSLDRHQLQDKLQPLSEAGATWWIEGLWDATEEAAVERIRRGPPSLVP